MPRKPSQAAIAETHKVNQGTISRLKKKGVDIYDTDAVQLALLTSQKRAPNVEAREIANGMSISDIKNIDEAKFLKEIVLIQKEQHKLDIELGRFVSVEELSDALQRIGAVVKSGVMRMVNDMPQLLEGKNAAEIRKILESKTNTVLIGMHEEFEEMSKQDEEE